MSVGAGGPWEVWFYVAAPTTSSWTTIPASSYFGEAVSPSNSAYGLQASGRTCSLGVRCKWGPHS